MLRKLLVIFSALILASSAAYNTSTYVYKTVDGLNLDALIYYPTNQTTTKYPVLFVVHGGGYIIGSTISAAISTKEIDEALSRSWVIVSINFRLCPGTPIDGLVQDIVDAHAWVRTTLSTLIPIDTNLITVYGISSGGVLSLITGFRFNPRPQAIISYYPRSPNMTEPRFYNPDTPVSASLIAEANNFRQIIGQYTTVPNDPRYAFFLNVVKEAKSGWVISTSDPNLPSKRVLAKLRSISPAYNVDANYPPTYLSHGLIDTQVLYSESVNMAAILKAKGIPYVLDLVPDASHGFNTGAISTEMWEDHVLPAFDFAEKAMKESQLKKKSANILSGLSGVSLVMLIVCFFL